MSLSDSTPASSFVIPSIALSNDADNLKAIERWAHEFMVACASPSRCHLFIPHKFVRDLDAAASLDNWVTIERWARSVITGSCSPSAFSSSCHLFIPHKTVLGDLQRGAISLATAQDREFDNYKTVENWANRLHRGEC